MPYVNNYINNELHQLVIILAFIFTAVVMAEIVKLVICICLVMHESGGVKTGVQSMYSTVVLNIKDTVRVCVPSFLYILQNNLLYVSAANLDAATYQVLV